MTLLTGKSLYISNSSFLKTSSLFIQTLLCFDDTISSFTQHTNNNYEHIEKHDNYCALLEILRHLSQSVPLIHQPILT